MILRLSQKLSKKLGEDKLATLALDENPYADWSCHLFTADRTQYIIMSNTKSLYSCVMYGRGITSDSHFIKRALDTIRDCLEEDGQAFAYQRFIAPFSAQISFAKALNRSVTGSMNDLIGHAKFMLTNGEIAPSAVGYKLNETPMSALGADRDYGVPNDEFKLLADELQ